MKGDFDILYEDNHLLGVVKPFNVPVQQDSTEDADLLNKLKGYIKEKYNKPGNAFVALLHRMDRPAGGVMIFARTSKAASRLSPAFNQRRVEKQYLCIVEGKPTPVRQRVQHWLKKDRRRNIVSVYTEPVNGTQKSSLRYNCIETLGHLSLVSVFLETGRSHQIRAQLSNIGLPLYGDHKYGNARAGQQLALWSGYLSFPHPVKNELVELKAPPPQRAPWDLFSRHYPMLHAT